MVHLLLSDTGYGKTSYIISKIKEDTESGVRSFLIVPEQQTVEYERAVATLLPPSAQLYCNALNFTRLANKIFRDHGGLRYNPISQSNKNLVMYQAICEVRGSLSEYKIKEGREYSCVKLFLDAIGELKAYSVTRDKLQKVIDKMNKGRLKSRLTDILLIWQSFEKLLGDKYNDPNDDFRLLDEKLKSVNYFADCNVYIDSFYGFTKSQLDIIRHIIMQAKNVTIALDMPANASENSLEYAKIVDAKNKIVTICDSLKKKYDDTTEFKNDLKHKNPAIKYLRDNVWNFEAKPLLSYSEVELVNADDEFDECEYVATKIKSLILNGARYKDIAIISRDVSSYKGIIDYALKKYNIPFFLSSPVDVLSMPVVKMIFSALSSISGYRCEDIVSYIKCDFTDVTEEELFDFESYMYKWNIYGKKFNNPDYWQANPAGYVAKKSKEQEEILTRVHSARNKVKSMLAILEKPFENKEKVSKIAEAVFDFLTAHKAKEQIEKEITGDGVSRQEAYELSQVWNILLSALDSLVAFCGDIYMSPEDFATVLRYALSDTKIGAIPTNNDVVVIGEAGLIRTSGIEYAFILGVNEGVFPASVEDNGFFSDTDKVALETHGIDLSSKTDLRAKDELLSLKNALSVPSKGLFVSCLKTNMAGKALQPSIAFTQLMNLLGIKKESIFNTSSIPAIDKIYTEENAKEYLAHSETAIGKAVKEVLGIKNPILGDFSNEKSMISSTTAKDIFGNFLSLSKTSIESFASCHFKYYCSYVLNLTSSQRIAFKSNDVGILNHHVIEKFFSLCKEESFDASKLTDDDIYKIVDEIIDNYVSSICITKGLSKKLIRLFGKLKKNLVVYLKNLIDEFSQSDFVPEYFELPIAGDGKNSPISRKFKVGKNATASLIGAADRVDIFRKNGKTYVRIVDYKSGTQSASLEFLSRGFGLQMFIYLFTLCKLGDCEFRDNLLSGTSEIVPAGIMYFPMNMGKKTIRHDIDIESGEVDKIESLAINEKITRTGFFLDDVEIIASQDKSGKYLPKKKSDNYLSLEEFDDVYNTLVKTIDQIGVELLSGTAVAEPVKVGKSSPCKYCEHEAFCRSRRRIKDEH